ncbi:MAG: serine hydrolase [Vicinamibacterales bacterium]
MTRLAMALLAVLGLVVPTVVQAAPQKASAKSSATPTRDKPAAAKKTSTASKKTTAAAAARARRARLARARAAARARELKDAQTPRFRLDETGQEVPDVRAEAAIIYNPVTREVLWSSNADAERSIASITKVMTALVVLESQMDPAQEVTVARSDVARASTTYIRAGYKVTVDDLLNLLLVGSDNAAARALARVSPYGADGFIDRMNEKARELGLASTHYADPSGLLADNVSSAYDMAQLIAYAAADERIGGVMRKTSYTTTSGKRVIKANSTNRLVKEGDIDVRGGKTGFISRAGYCLATLLRLPETGQQVAVVVLGAKSNAGRFWETRHLFNWLSLQDPRSGVQLPRTANSSRRAGVEQPLRWRRRSALHERRVERQRRHRVEERSSGRPADWLSSTFRYRWHPSHRITRIRPISAWPASGCGPPRRRRTRTRRRTPIARDSARTAAAARRTRCARRTPGSAAHTGQRAPRAESKGTRAASTSAVRRRKGLSAHCNAAPRPMTRPARCRVGDPGRRLHHTRARSGRSTASWPAPCSRRTAAASTRSIRRKMSVTSRISSRTSAQSMANSPAEASGTRAAPVAPAGARSARRAWAS